MLGYRDSGMADTEPNDHPDSFHRPPLDEATGRLVAVIRRDAPAGRSSPTATTSVATRTPTTCEVHDISVLAFERAGDPAWYPGGRRAVPAAEAVLLGVVEGAADRRPRGDDPASRASRRSTRTGSIARAHDHRITTRIDVGDLPVGPQRVRCGPTRPRSIPTSRGGSGSPTTSWPRCTRGRTGSWPARSSGRPADGDARATICSPAIRDGRWRSRERAVPGRVRQERRGGRGARRRRRGGHASPARRRRRSIRRSRSCGAS